MRMRVPHIAAMCTRVVDQSEGFACTAFVGARVGRWLRVYYDTGSIAEQF